MALNGLFVAKTIQASLDAPLPQLLPLNAFITDFSPEASAAASVTTRYAGAATVTDVPASGLAGQAGNSTAVTINLSNYKTVSYNFSELNRGQTLTPESLSQLFLVPAINGLANKVIADTLALGTSGNFTNQIVVPNATGFGLGTFVSGNYLLDTTNANPSDRYAIFNNSYKAELLKNNVYIQSYSYGNNDAISKGVLPPVVGITPLAYNGTIASTDGNLAGLIFQKNALCLAARLPAYEEVEGYGIVEAFEDPTTKLPMLLRIFNNMNGSYTLSVSTVYGVAAGTSQAVRITSS